MKHRTLARILTALVRGKINGCILVRNERVVIYDRIMEDACIYTFADAMSKLYGEENKMTEILEDIAFTLTQAHKRAVRTGHTEIDIKVTVNDGRIRASYGDAGVAPVSGNLDELSEVLDGIDERDVELWKICYAE